MWQQTYHLQNEQKRHPCVSYILSERKKRHSFSSSHDISKMGQPASSHDTDSITMESSELRSEQTPPSSNGGRCPIQISAFQSGTHNWLCINQGGRVAG
jgi:hypothetical protein